MLLRLSRTLFWVAAFSAAASLAVSEREGTWLTGLAGVALIASFGCWRMAAAHRRAERLDQDPIAAASLDRAGLLEAAALSARAVACAETFDAALLAALEVLRAELGCRVAVAHRVMALEPPLARLITLIDAGPGGRGVEHRVRLDHSPLGTALRDRRPAGRGDGPYALPVLHLGDPVAVLELGEPALATDGDGLGALFDLVGLQLSEAARRAAGASADAPPEGPPGPRAVAGVPDVISSRAAQDVAVDAGNGITGDVADNTAQFPAQDEMPRPASPPAATAPPADVPGAGAPPAAARVLDAAALEKLRELDPKGDNRLIQRVMQAFETSVGRLLPQLREAEANGDRGGIRHVVHTLKASSASIGAMALSQQCADVESRLRAGETDGLESRLAVIYDELDNVMGAVRAWTGLSA